MSARARSFSVYASSMRTPDCGPVGSEPGTGCESKRSVTVSPPAIVTGEVGASAALNDAVAMRSVVDASRTIAAASGSGLATSAVSATVVPSDTVSGASVPDTYRGAGSVWTRTVPTPARSPPEPVLTSCQGVDATTVRGPVSVHVPAPATSKTRLSTAPPARTTPPPSKPAGGVYAGGADTASNAMNALDGSNTASASPALRTTTVKRQGVGSPLVIVAREAPARTSWIDGGVWTVIVPDVTPVLAAVTLRPLLRSTPATVASTVVTASTSPMRVTSKRSVSVSPPARTVSPPAKTGPLHAQPAAGAKASDVGEIVRTSTALSPALRTTTRTASGGDIVAERVAVGEAGMTVRTSSCAGLCTTRLPRPPVSVVACTACDVLRSTASSVPSIVKVPVTIAPVVSSVTTNVTVSAAPPASTLPPSNAVGVPTSNCADRSTPAAMNRRPADVKATSAWPLLRTAMRTTIGAPWSAVIAGCDVAMDSIARSGAFSTTTVSAVVRSETKARALLVPSRWSVGA